MYSDILLLQLLQGLMPLFTQEAKSQSHLGQSMSQQAVRQLENATADRETAVRNAKVAMQVSLSFSTIPPNALLPAQPHS